MIWSLGEEARSEAAKIRDAEAGRVFTLLSLCELFAVDEELQRNMCRRRVGPGPYAVDTCAGGGRVHRGNILGVFHLALPMRWVNLRVTTMGRALPMLAKPSRARRRNISGLRESEFMVPSTK